ncbi:MAG TPA: DUF3105 domain-containing protein [Actinomycetota bacterium]
MSNHRETKRERREAARLARIEAQRRAARKRKMRGVLTLVALVVIAGLIGVAVYLSGASARRAGQELARLAAPAGCTEVQSFGDEGSTHVDSPTDVEYRTTPPTSGNHYGNVGNTGIYHVQAPDENMVHNLEHGHVGIWYAQDGIDDAVLEALKGVVRENATGAFLSPRPDLPDGVTIAFTAWQHMSTCGTPGASEDVAAYAGRFIEAQGAKGPEGFLPGSPAGV